MSPEDYAAALHAAAVLAVDPIRLGGAVVRAGAGPVRDHWLETFAALLPPAERLRRLPVHATEDRLLGGLDLAATLSTGRVVADRGLLAEANGGVVVVPMAERLEATTVAHLGVALDFGELRVERDGIARREATRFAVLALDEGAGSDEAVPTSLGDRLALRLDLGAIPPRRAHAAAAPTSAAAVASARLRLPSVQAEPAIVQALCGAALALGVPSLRPPALALRFARAAAALDGRTAVEPRDAELAAAFVIAPRATRLPAADREDEPEPPPNPEPPPPGDGETEEAPPPEGALDDVILAAAHAAVPPGLLAELTKGLRRRARAAAGGPAGAVQSSPKRGRRAGVRRGDPRRGKLDVVETLRAAAPWQRVRRTPSDARRVAVRTEDFRVVKFKERSETTTIFCVDASGSAALHRLAEAKGAVEQLLADYVRRDHVALVAFRGADADLLLPPTRSLVRAKRSLAGLPGGGTTPLARGIEAAARLAHEARRRGHTPVIVFMTDGRANVDREGSPGRAKAAEDARRAALQLHREGFAALFVDVAPRSGAGARELAAAMNARYLHLPHADSGQISTAVQELAPGA